MADFGRELKRKNKRKMSNRESGRYDEPATHWWKRRLGIGNQGGEGAMAKSRKKAQDRKIDEDS